MAVRKVNYCYVTVPNRPGQGARVLGQLKDARVNLLAYSGFPTKGGMAQLDLVAKSIVLIRRVTRKNGWRLSKVKKGFLIQGTDRPGAVHRHIQKLADASINVTAADAVCAGQGRYGMLLWVKGKDYGRAARALKAK
ncbi:MAG TPA: hypothetical protein VGK93_06500 [Candidatus Eisenbacteria bacterium]|jgi:hypothetical protein